MSKSIFIYQPSGIKIEIPNLLGKKYDINGVTLSIEECITPPIDNLTPKLSLSCLQEKLRRTVFRQSSPPEVKELPAVKEPASSFASSSILSVSSSSPPEVKELPAVKHMASSDEVKNQMIVVPTLPVVSKDVSVVNHVRRSLHNTCSESNQLIGRKRCLKGKNDKKKNYKTSSSLTSMFENLEAIPLVSEIYILKTII